MYPKYSSTSKVKPNFMYHGSPDLFNLPDCRESTRFKNGKVIWKGTAVFASHDRRIALNYTHNKVDTTKYTCGVDLTKWVANDEPLIIGIFGDNEEDTLNRLYGTGADDDSTGYLYLMNADFFEHETGLGLMEKISRTPEKPGFLLKVEKINRRKEINSYVEKGLIKINFNHYSKLHQTTSSIPAALMAKPNL